MHENPLLPTILLTHYGNNWIRGSERCLLDLIANIDRTRFRIVLWCNSKIVGEAGAALGIKVITTDFTCLFNNTSISRVKDYFRIANIANYIINKYDVKLVHANSAAPSLWLNRACRANKIPLISHLHSFYTLKDRIIFSLHQATMIVGVSKSVLYGLSKDGVPACRLKVIENGLDLKRLLAQKKVDIRDQLQLDKQDYLVATTGSLIHRKGIDMAISATIKIRKSGIPIHLLILGEGPIRCELENIIRKNNASSYVHLHGESDRIFGILRGGVNLYISTAKEEAFGLSIAEASLAGIPVIAPNFGEISNIIKHNISGKLYPRCDEKQLIKNMKILYQNPIKARRLGVCGFDHIISNYDITRYTNSFEKLFSDTISNNVQYCALHTRSKLSNIPPSIAFSLFRVLKNIFRSRATS
ncbi:hypothetical protein A9Q81_15595 [Gammaproteobacteria bacterium 42_54_T18]|nr:hypothetical protein A9Q81_15595 [Gammaproteobacteria bacterium 42_54_T18]